jgi:phospholipase C
MISMCIENPSPSWNEDHLDWNLTNPVSATATSNGFVFTAAHDARNLPPPFSDTNGIRAMAYYDGEDLPFYYSMASSFGTSDRWFSPVMTNSPSNHMYCTGWHFDGARVPVSPEGTHLKLVSYLSQSVWKTGTGVNARVRQAGSWFTYSVSCLN